MNIQPQSPGSWKKINLGSEKLRKFFIKHLDHIYLAKQHLVSKLPALMDNVQFSDLKNAMTETTSLVDKQLARIELIYTLMDESVTDRNMNGLTGLIDDAFEAIREQAREPELRDLSIIYYLQNIESVEMASFQILQMAAVKLENKQIGQLLKENYDDAKAGRTLFLLISSKYIIS
ncbi:hypothetical protein BC343_19380 [Mucilaginibacter pedocola]|uniref:Uncharacterized protein n=2 Tax=Mucilaginibacter pedocola TaxID=1792845 RepID=A0A1S9P6V8_9SPHI|nr:hypothetical protein BC343_19380 [Mucilaginibacter pedocola]